MKIPFMDLGAGLKGIRQEIDQKIAEMIDNTSFIGGPVIRNFEKNFAAYCGTVGAVGCANGTDALFVGLKALGIGPGQKVIVPANSFIATAEAVSMAGAEVVFVDVLPGEWTLDPKALQDYFDSGQSAAAIIPVHLYGKMARMEELLPIASKNGASVIEDAAQAHGALRDSRGPGLWGDLATFSFYPGKNLGAFGDAGALVSQSKDILESAQAFVNHGRAPGEKYLHKSLGGNFRMDTLQAAILDIKLKHLSEDTEARIKLAMAYTQGLSNRKELILPEHFEKHRDVFHLYVVHLQERDRLKEFLQERKISTGIHYPVPLHMQEAYKDLEIPKGNFQSVNETQSNV
jgi:dTDP-4-amino-4,6-dideoxygalactose transaminase